ncbi:MAG: hypothetical protein KJ549_08155 [Alphaproteobacteria bacterium]|nr:hypothetical protein [Alphaproteobacteria bacterium]MBU1462192.1 hypothetical protein [Alphaproteobacteria bacterium]
MLDLCISTLYLRCLTSTSIIAADCPDNLALLRFDAMASHNSREHPRNQLVEPGHDIAVDIRLGMSVADTTIVGKENIAVLQQLGGVDIITYHRHRQAANRRLDGRIGEASLTST